MGAEAVEELRWKWRFWARPGQLPPGSIGALADRREWVHWLPLAGRGWGKTRVGAETTRQWAENPNCKIHLVGPTSSSIRSVMIDGPSGLMACYPPYRRPDYEPSRHRVLFPSGAIGETFSADEPERLRGPQCTHYWADEPCAWRFLDDAWDNLMFGFRLGEDTQGVITTTPKPSRWLREIMSSPDTVVTRHSTYENRAFLAKSFFDSVIRKYEGTRIGRQELMAEVLDDTPGALWTLANIEKFRQRGAVNRDELVRVVVAIDPAVSAGEDSADTGIVVVALMTNGHVLVLEDLTVHGSPLEWATVAKQAYDRWQADRIVGEVNNGGDLVEGNLRVVDAFIPFRSVRATRGKAVRAEPVAALYEQGRVHHVGAFPDLESQMCTFVPGAPRTAKDRLDRMDALVWGVTDFLEPEEVQELTPVFSRVSISRY